MAWLGCGALTLQLTLVFHLSDANRWTPVGPSHCEECSFFFFFFGAWLKLENKRAEEACCASGWTAEWAVGVNWNLGPAPAGGY